MCDVFFCPICGNKVKNVRQPCYFASCYSCNWVGYTTSLITKIDFIKKQRKEKLNKLKSDR